MTKDVSISISGLHLTEENTNEPVEVITFGTYYKKNGKHYVLFEEVMEGFAETTKNTVRMEEGVFEITKRGVMNTHMLFEKNRKNMTYYRTPYGSLPVGIDAGRIRIDETEDCIEVRVEYALEVNYEHFSDCTITMTIRSRQA